MDDTKRYIIVAVDAKNGIGKDEKLPWSFKKEMAFFRDTTSETFEEDTQNMVIMGRKTWETLPEKFRPLPDRKNVVVTHNQYYKAEGAAVVHSLGEAFKLAELDEKVENVFIIGGAQIFSLALDVVDGMYLTKIEKSYDCDTFFPDFTEAFPNPPENLGTEEEDGTGYTFNFYGRNREL